MSTAKPTTTRALSHEAIQAMTTAQLTELVKVDRETIKLHKVAAIGYPGYFSSEFPKKECRRAWYEIRAAEKELMRRQQALEMGLDRDATASAVAA